MPIVLGGVGAIAGFYAAGFLVIMAESGPPDPNSFPTWFLLGLAAGTVGGAYAGYRFGESL